MDFTLILIIAATFIFFVSDATFVFGRFNLIPRYIIVQLIEVDIF